MISHQISVDLGDRSYPIYVGRGMLSAIAPTLQKHGLTGRVALITDANVAMHYQRAIEKHLRHFGYDTYSIVVPPGERHKSLTRAGKIYSELLHGGIDRKSFVLALGGGVIGDLAGFVAATYQRGIPHVQVPTTLLAQVDSSVGGKVAINLPMGKNMIGAFYQPSVVWVDGETLNTLPFRELICGMGEVVKYGIALDADLFTYVEAHLDEILKRNPEHLLHVQTRCLAIKSHIVSEDEKETGRRAILNLGHTIGHALEAAGDYRFFKHGEAVLLGTVAESYIAKEMGLVSSDVHTRIVDTIRRLPIKRGVGNLNAQQVVRLMKGDKKSTEGVVRFVLPAKIGEAKLVDRVDQKLVVKSLKYLRELNF